MKFLLIVILAVVVGCGGDTKKRFNPNNDNNSNNVNNANNVNNSNNANNTNNLNNTIVGDCGNGVLDGAESCDPGITSGEGACPTVCPNSPDACGTFVLVGEASTCTAACEFEPKACMDADGCCPTGCDSSTDTDCTNQCGDGIVEGSEICDGDCPESCDDSDSCTVDSFSGSADTCNLVCSYAPRTVCQGGDGCCPSGCTSSNDSDCMCQPTTSCQAQGFTCGTLFNGCENVSCGQCPNGQNCQNNVCQMPETFGVGTPCTVDAQCAGGKCITEAELGWPGGYCSKTCSTTAQCGVNQNCEFNSDGDGLCVERCSSDAQCPRSGYRCGDRDFDGVDACFPAGNGTRPVGDTCTSSDQCSGSVLARCFGNPTEFPNGYCSRLCENDSHCGAGAHCADGGFCLENCTTSSQCQSGLACYDEDGDGQKECSINATGSGAVGTPCTSISQCAGGQWGRCVAEDDQGNAQGGYCTIFCDTGEGTCPAGSSCWTQNNFCVDECDPNGTNQCRSGYQCLDLGEIFTPLDACWF